MGILVLSTCGKNIVIWGTLGKFIPQPKTIPIQFHFYTVFRVSESMSDIINDNRIFISRTNTFLEL